MSNKDERIKNVSTEIEMFLFAQDINEWEEKCSVHSDPYCSN